MAPADVSDVVQKVVLIHLYINTQFFHGVSTLTAQEFFKTYII